MAETDFASLKALVIDDEAFMRNLIIRILGEIGITDVLSARDGAEGLEIIEENNTVPNIIICDLEMPEMDGFEFVRRMRASSSSVVKNLPVLIVTGHAEPESIYNAVNAGIHGYLVKPISKKALEGRIANALVSDPIDPSRVPR